MMSDSGTKERLAQVTKVISPSLNDLFQDLGSLLRLEVPYLGAS